MSSRVIPSTMYSKTMNTLIGQILRFWAISTNHSEGGKTYFKQKLGASPPKHFHDGRHFKRNMVA